MTTEHGKSVAELLRTIESDAAAEREQAARELGGLESSQWEVVRALEQVAAADPEQRVREAALHALQSVAHRAIQQRSAARFSDAERAAVLAEIARLQAEGLITSQQAALLRGRYGFGTVAPAEAHRLLAKEIQRWRNDNLVPPELAAELEQRYEAEAADAAELAAAETPPAPLPVAEVVADVPSTPEPVTPATPPVTKPVEDKPAAPPRTLGELLLSETTIKIALYLGAFFVVAAAFILAALIDVIRLPILILVTLGFFGATALSAWRLRTASFTFFAIAVLLVPIDVGVVLDLFNVRAADSEPYWAVVSIVVAVLWAAGTLFYKSRLFSLLSFGALTLAAALVGSWLQATGHGRLFLFAPVTVAGLLAAFGLRRWQGNRLFVPLFVLAQLQQFGIFVISAGVLFLGLVGPGLPGGITWLAVAGTWLLGALFYALSDWRLELSGAVLQYLLFRIPTVIAVIPIPLFLVGVFSPTTGVVMAIAWVWGAVLAAASEIALRLPWARVRSYGYLLLAGSVLLFATAVIGGGTVRIEFAFGYLVGATVVYGALTALRRRWYVWLGALLSGELAYLTFFLLPAVNDFVFKTLGLTFDLVLMFPVLAYLTLDLVLRRRLKVNREWHLPPLGLGLLTGGLSVFFSGVSIFAAPRTAWLGFLIYAAYFTVYALVDTRWYVWLGALVAGGLGYLGIFNLPAIADLEIFPGVIALLPVLFYLSVNFLVRRVFKVGAVWQLPPLGLGSFAGLVSLPVAVSYGFERPQGAALVFAIYAGYFALYALLEARPELGYLTTAGVALAVPFLLGYYEQTTWLAPLTGLTAFYYLSGLALVFAARRLSWVAGWGAPLRHSGLALGVLTVLSAPFQGGPASIGSTVLIGTFFAVEAFRLRNPWLRHTTTALYLWAYVLALGALVVSESTTVLIAAAVLGILVLAAYFVVYALTTARPPLLYAATGSLAFALPFLLNALEQTTWLAPFMVLIATYYFGGLGLTVAVRFVSRLTNPGWATVLRSSGLVLGLFVAASAPFQGGPAAVVVTALIATSYAVESFLRRNVWLGFPTGFLYLGAYFMVLVELDVTQPQFFSIAAALLGVIMHYLLVRSGNGLAAFWTGLVAQLILLSTTYIQMISTGMFRFFFVLFFQALALLVYGVIIRSRSFVFIPIGFSILTVITAAFSVLEGLALLFVIGCTGLLLMLLGVVALVLRERLIASTAGIRERLEDWQA